MTPFAKRPNSQAALFFYLIFALAACQKPEQDIGLNLQPDDNLLGVGTRVFDLTAYTTTEDSIRSDNVTPALLGAYIDPVFGFAKAGHVTELRLQDGNPVFVPAGIPTDSVVVDSVVLILAYNYTAPFDFTSAHYGNLGAQYLQVYQITDSLETNKAYYHRTTPNFIAQDLVKENHNLFKPRPADSLVVAGAKAPPQIRVRLREDFADRFLFANPGGPLSASQFVTLFKGLYITVDETQFNTFKSGIIYFDTFNQRSKVTIYYRYSNNGVGESREYSLDLRGNTGKYNTFQHDRTLADVDLQNQLAQASRSPNFQTLYVQAMGGTKIIVDIPQLDSLKNLGNKSINQAVVILPLRANSAKNFGPPAAMFILGRDAEGNTFLLDDQLEGAQFSGGAYDAGRNEYRFKVSRYLQRVILGQREFHGFEIVSARAAFSANRAILNGGQHPDKNLKLAITFTEF